MQKEKLMLHFTLWSKCQSGNIAIKISQITTKTISEEIPFMLGKRKEHYKNK